MATPVPYTGTEEVAPQLNPLSPVHEDTPVAAFGGAVAGALTHMGDVAEGAGKELFARAYAMQELNEQVRADSKASDVFDKQTQIYLKFDNLKGQERIDAYPQYMKDLAKVREDGAAELTSPFAKMNYLRDTRRNESMMIWHGGILARQGADDAAKQASLGKIDAQGNTLATLQVSDGPEFDAGVSNIKRDAANYVHEQFGFPPGSDDNNRLASKFLSKQIAKVAIARSNADPVDGKAFFEKMSSSGMLQPEDSDQIKGRIESSVDNKTSADLARKAIHKLGPDAKPSDIEKEARTSAEKADPGNDNLADNAATRALTQYDHQERVKFLSEQQDRTTLLQTIDGTNSQDGKVPISLEDAMKQPGFTDAYHNLSPESQNVLLKQIRHNQEIGGVEHNPKGDLAYYRMMQIGINRNTSSTPQELDDLANVDLLKPPFDSLTREQRQNLLKVQGEVINNQIQNPSMSHALHLPTVTQMLQEAGIDEKSNPDEYNKFQVTYHNAIINYGLGAERSVKNDKELADIATGLINKQAGAWFSTIRGISTTQPYNSIIDFSEQAKKAGRTEFRNQFGREPDLDSEADKNLTNQLALRAIYQGYGQQSKPVKEKRTDRVGQ